MHIHAPHVDRDALLLAGDLAGAALWLALMALLFAPPIVAVPVIVLAIVVRVICWAFR